MYRILSRGVSANSYIYRRWQSRFTDALMTWKNATMISFSACSLSRLTEILSDQDCRMFTHTRSDTNGVLANVNWMNFSGISRLIFRVSAVDSEFSSDPSLCSIVDCYSATSIKVHVRLRYVCSVLSPVIDKKAHSLHHMRDFYIGMRASRHG